MKWDNEQLPQRNAASPKETNALLHPTRVGIVNYCKCFSQRNVNMKSYFFLVTGTFSILSVEHWE